MISDSSILKYEEKTDLALRALYEKHGYQRYTMSKFEEYDLYAKNKDFLVSGNVITFTESNGRLMALKPDVTLSIVRSGRDIPGNVEKLYYNENVYRVSGSTHSFREIMQAGLECIGEIDDFCLAEALILAAESLKIISPDSVLVISHLGVISRLLERLSISDDGRAKVLKYLGEKNAHELSALLSGNTGDSDAAAALVKLIGIHGSASEVALQLRALGCGGDEAEQIEKLGKALDCAGFVSNIRFDFSVVNDMRYYNGIVFKGYVSGIPVSVISGGQYDKLLRRMGRTSGAVGFAVYLDTVERLHRDVKQYDVDTVLLYDRGDDICEVFKAAKQLETECGCVMTVSSVPAKLSCRVLAKYTPEGVEILETNA